ncbi:hypothetical protein AGLY_004605 [Aphis glycines]|uniref:Gustatory receptor n=1 Tax=Aphis glycines TaxID=307491 RepID=A0A6G0TWR1_APHGL|nr:hypothetical protein AGLY_004605 [Aphis glycines]
MITVFHRTLRPILFLSKCITLINILYTVKLSELLVHTLKFINGMIEFDRKLTTISTKLLSKQRSFSKSQWDMFLISFFLYFIVYKFLNFVFSPVKTVNIFTLTFVLFALSFILDYVITSSLCYFLHNLHARFWTLNDLWKFLPAELAVDHDKWTHIEIDLDHCFWLSSHSALLIGIFFMVTRFHLIAGERSAAQVRDQIFNATFHIQIVIFMMTIIVYVSFIEEQRIKIISYLRSYRISNLHIDFKKQIKMFMNQMSVPGLDQVTAFGFFDVNLNLVMSIIVLIITGITTLVQMKHDPIIMKLTLRPILFLSKCIGLIGSTYAMESTGLLVHNVKPLCHMCFEITRFINSMIEFDRKLALFSTSLFNKQRSFSKKQWDIFLISLYLYFIVMESSKFFVRPVKNIAILILLNILFIPPFILDFFITSSLCFFLHNLHARFWTLNDL